MMMTITGILILSIHYLIVYFTLFFISFDYYFFLAHSFMYLTIYLSLDYLFVNYLFIFIFYFHFHSFVYLFTQKTFEVLDRNLIIWWDSVNIIHLITVLIICFKSSTNLSPSCLSSHSHPDSKYNRANHIGARHQIVPCLQYGYYFTQPYTYFLVGMTQKEREKGASHTQLTVRFITYQHYSLQSNIPLQRSLLMPFDRR